MKRTQPPAQRVALFYGQMVEKEVNFKKDVKNSALYKLGPFGLELLRIIRKSFCSESFFKQCVITKSRDVSLSAKS